MDTAPPDADVVRDSDSACGGTAAAAAGAVATGAGGAGAGEGNKALNAVVRRAADAITNLAHENGSIKSRVRWVDSPHCTALHRTALHCTPLHFTALSWSGPEWH